jgi:hypothetical protein
MLVATQLCSLFAPMVGFEPTTPFAAGALPYDASFGDVARGGQAAGVPQLALASADCRA